MKSFNKDQILSMSLPGDLFSSPENIDEEFRSLSVQWHPDHKDGDQDVMAKINELRESAKLHASSGKWEASNSIVIPSKSGSGIKIKFLSRHDIGIGEMFVCSTCVAFVIRKEFSNMAGNIQILNSLKFSGKRMKDEIQKSLPRLNHVRTGTSGEKIVVVNRSPDMFLLQGVLDYYGGKIPPRHVAWIMNTLYNLCCYFSYTDLTHNGILIDSYFISPKEHGGSLLGGWWYAVPRHAPISIIPTEIYSILPVKVKNSKVASVTTDLESVKLIGRQLLGDSTGMELDMDSDVPTPMIHFLRDISSNDAIFEYKCWNETLRECFGPRRFVEMKIDEAKLYNT